MKHRVIRARLLAHVAVLAATLAGCNALVGNDDIQVSDGAAVVEGASASDASSSDVTHDVRALDAASEALPATDSPMTGDSPADTLREEGGDDSADAAPIPEAAVDTGPTCTAPSQICGNVCTDVTSDNSHCGNCMTSCTGSKTCQSGVCACPTRLTDCSGACVDELTDNSNCGVCGTRCPAGATGTICIGGMCACSAGLTNCNGTCVNAQTDNAHCGNCTTMCTGGMTGTNCVGGVCSCGANATNCSGVCSTLSNDNANCGGCGIKCTGGSSCAGTTCTCPTGQAYCNGVCVNLASDSNNCGSCAKVCSLVACTGGYCVQRLGVGWTTQHAGTAGFSTSYAFGEPVTFSATFTITALGVHNATAVTGNIVMGLYTDSGGLPYTLLAETAVSGMYQGNEELPLSYRVAPGKYWVVAQSSVTPPWGYGSPGTYFFSNVGAYSGTLPSPMPEPMPPTLSGTTNAGSIDFYLVGDQ